MNFTPVKTPKIAKKLFPSLIWNFSTSKKVIYLTFDDGPTPEITNWVLDTLNTYNAKATFFCIGKNISENPVIFKRILQDGHSIGNHTYNHLKGWETKTKDYLENVKLCNEVITQYSNSEIGKLFRPPYGKMKRKQLKELQRLGYRIIMWNVLSVDWDKNVTEEVCLKNVLDNTSSGSIVVFHDSVKAFRNMQYALPKVLNYFTEREYSFKRIPV